MLKRASRARRGVRAVTILGTCFGVIFLGAATPTATKAQPRVSIDASSPTNVEIEVMGGGRTSISAIPGCSGYVADTSSATIEVQNGSVSTLLIGVSESLDVVILARGSDGRFRCIAANPSTGALASLDPGTVTGRLDLWIGSTQPTAPSPRRVQLEFSDPSQRAASLSALIGPTPLSSLDGVRHIIRASIPQGVSHEQLLGRLVDRSFRLLAGVSGAPIFDVSPAQVRIDAGAGFSREEVSQMRGRERSANLAAWGVGLGTSSTNSLEFNLFRALDIVQTRRVNDQGGPTRALPDDAYAYVSAVHLGYMFEHRCTSSSATSGVNVGIPVASAQARIGVGNQAQASGSDCQSTALGLQSVDSQSIFAATEEELRTRYRTSQTPVPILVEYTLLPRALEQGVADSSLVEVSIVHVEFPSRKPNGNTWDALFDNDPEQMVNFRWAASTGQIGAGISGHHFCTSVWRSIAASLRRPCRPERVMTRNASLGRGRITDGPIELTLMDMDVSEHDTPIPALTVSAWDQAQLVFDEDSGGYVLTLSNYGAVIVLLVRPVSGP